jgi:hypothetical protein
MVTDNHKHGTIEVHMVVDFATCPSALLTKITPDGNLKYMELERFNWIKSEWMLFRIPARKNESMANPTYHLQQ